MTTPKDNDKAFGLLRELPVEVSIEQVGLMVVAFPLAGASAAWLAWTKLHLNSIIMSTTGSIIVGGSIYLFSAGGPAPREKTITVQEKEPVEAAIEQAPDSAPAAVLEMPEQPVPVSSPAPISAPEPNEPPAPLCQESSVEPAAPADEEDFIPLVASLHGGMPHPSFVVAPAVVLRVCDYTRSFELKGFHSVSLVSSIDVTVQEGDFSVVATGDEKAVERVRITVKDDRLIIDQEPMRPYKEGCDGAVSVLVSMPQLKRAEVLGSGDMTLGEFKRAEGLTLNVQGSGDLMMGAIQELGTLNVGLDGSGDVLVGEANVSGITTIRVSGSGDVRVAGRTTSIDIGLVGSGDVMASDMRAAMAKVRLVGSGDVSVNSESAVDQSVQGSGEVHVSGSSGGDRPRGVGSRVY